MSIHYNPRPPHEPIEETTFHRKEATTCQAIDIDTPYSTVFAIWGLTDQAVSTCIEMAQMRVSDYIDNMALKAKRIDVSPKG